MVHLRLVAPLILSILLAAGTARADDAPDPHPARWSVTSNLVFLVLPVVNASGEYRLADRSTLSARAGVGRVTIDQPIGGDETNTVVEVGAAYRYYLLGSFDAGAFLGGDVRYVDAGTGELLKVESALCAGAMAGYKHILSFGLTFDLRLGAQIAFGEADGAVVPLVFAGAGWSF